MTVIWRRFDGDLTVIIHVNLSRTTEIFPNSRPEKVRKSSRFKLGVTVSVRNASRFKLGVRVRNASRLMLGVRVSVRVRVRVKVRVQN